MAHHIELNPVSHYTIGVIGEPGNRTFYLQGKRDEQVISLIIEKEQARLFAGSLLTLWDELMKAHPITSDQPGTAIYDMRLIEPVEPLFRVGSMGLGYDELTDRVVLMVYELVEEDEEPNRVSFWCARTYIRPLSEHIMEVVNRGRPICGNCGKPIDADGHFCPQSNGHAK